MADNDSDNDIFARQNQRKINSGTRRPRDKNASFDAENMDNEDLEADIRLSRTGPINPNRKSAAANNRGGNNENENNNDRSGPNRNSKPLAGWGDDPQGSPSMQEQRSNRRRGSAGMNEKYETNNNNNNNNNNRRINQREIVSNNDDEIDIPEIPDLDEQNEAMDDMAFKVAEAPDVQVYQISSYKELDHEFFKEKAFQFLEGNIDVSMLHCGLNTEKEVAEEDDIWEWNKLFTEVVSVIAISQPANNAGGAFDDELDIFYQRGAAGATGTRSDPTAAAARRTAAAAAAAAASDFPEFDAPKNQNTQMAIMDSRNYNSNNNNHNNDAVADDLISSSRAGTGRNQGRYNRKRNDDDLFKDFMD